MAIEVTSPPAVEPFTTEEAKLHLRQDLDADDTLIDAAIVAARTYAENFMHRKLITQTVTITSTGWQGARFRLPIAPIQSIDSIQYVDTAGDTQTLSSSNYQLVKSVLPYSIAPAYGLTWPSVRSDYDNVTVAVVAGYGDASTDIPRDIMQALRLLLAHFYENRSDENVGQVQVTRLGIGAHRLLAPHILWI